MKYRILATEHGLQNTDCNLNKTLFGEFSHDDAELADMSKDVAGRYYIY